MTKKTSMNKLTRMGSLRTSVNPSNTWPLPDQYVGLEIEIEDYSTKELALHHDAGMPYWTTHNDGSLRNGIEYVLNQPMLGEELTKAIDYFFSKITTYSDSPRTSIHVHLNMRQAEDTVEGLRNLVVLYYMMEDAFFSVADEGRKWNGYCNAFEDNPHTFLNMLVKPGVSMDDMEMYLAHLADHNNNRYYGLNLAALRRYGTIEFRHFPLVREKDRLVDWIRLLMETKKAAQALADEGVSFRDMFKEPDDLIKLRDYMPLFGDVLLARVDPTRAFMRMVALYGMTIEQTQGRYTFIENNKLWDAYVTKHGGTPQKKTSSRGKKSDFIENIAALQNQFGMLARADVARPAVADTRRLNGVNTFEVWLDAADAPALRPWADPREPAPDEEGGPF